MPIQAAHCCYLKQHSPSQILSASIPNLLYTTCKLTMYCVLGAIHCNAHSMVSCAPHAAPTCYALRFVHSSVSPVFPFHNGLLDGNKDVDTVERVAEGHGRRFVAPAWNSHPELSLLQLHSSCMSSCQDTPIPIESEFACIPSCPWLPDSTCFRSSSVRCS